jgi:lysozyme family protein
MKDNFPTALSFVWRKGFDDPADGYHVTPGDPGGGTFGGVIEATWDVAVADGIVHGALKDASQTQLSAVLDMKFWGQACDALPAGLDLLLFNGRMMTGRFPWLFQQALGFIGPQAVDGSIGPVSLAAAGACQPQTFINAVCGAHAAYLAELPIWTRFGAGWTTRIKAARTAALALADATTVAAER